jgi:hypothetical protein
MPAREIGTYTIYLCRNGKRFKTLPNVAENIPRPTIETRTLNLAPSAMTVPSPSSKNSGTHRNSVSISP